MATEKVVTITDLKMGNIALRYNKSISDEYPNGVIVGTGNYTYVDAQGDQIDNTVEKSISLSIGYDDAPQQFKDLLATMETSLYNEALAKEDMS